MTITHQDIADRPTSYYRRLALKAAAMCAAVPMGALANGRPDYGRYIAAKMQESSFRMHALKLLCKEKTGHSFTNAVVGDLAKTHSLLMCEYCGCLPSA